MAATTIAAAFLLAVEFLALMLRFTTASLAGSSQEWAHVLTRSTILPQLALTSATGVMLFSSHVLERELRQMRETLDSPVRRARAVVVQLAFFALLYFATRQVFEPHVQDETAPWGWIGLWVVAAIGTVFSGAGLFLSLRDSRALARRTAGPVCTALAIGVAAWGVGVLSAEALRLPLRTPTLWLSRALLQLLTDDVIVNVPQFVFGTSRFSVQIAPQCSGLEGVGLILAFTAAYLLIARDSLRFPRALLIPVIGMLSAWILNALRMSSLVAIGSWISPDLAVGGFHTLAGLIAFCAVSLGLVLLTRRSAFFSRPVHAAPLEQPRDMTLALLGPFLAFVACGVALMLLGTGRAQFYPLQPLVAVAVLLLLRKSYSFPISYGSWPAVATGIAAFLVWVSFASTNGDGAAIDSIRSALSGMDSWSRWTWIGARILGFGLVTPLIEELAFRSYLQRRLTARDWEKVPLAGFSWTALLATSLMFGALHDSWLRATLVGLMYGIVLRRRGKLSDAVVAHATTNVLVLLQAWWQQDWTLLG